MHIDCVDLDSSSNVYGVILIEADNYTGRQVREANEFLAKYKDKDDLPF